MKSTIDLLPPRNIRSQKGTSLLEIPSDFTVVDIETTGLSPAYDSIIEIAAIRYINGSVSDTFNSLLKPDEYRPCFIDSFIEELTGITDDMICQAPPSRLVLQDFSSFIGKSTIIAHNAHFDINFLYDNLEHYCDYTLSNNFVDTMRISKLLHRELAHHRLKDLAEYYNIPYDGAHRALSDCDITLSIYLKMLEEFYSTHGENITLSALKHHHHVSTKSKDITTSNVDFDESHPLFGKVCVFTGTLEQMLRKDAMQIVADLGGINGDSVTKKTNYLILGNNDYCSTIKDGKSAKQKKAEQLQLAGFDISIISENVFYDMIFE